MISPACILTIDFVSLDGEQDFRRPEADDQLNPFFSPPEISLVPPSTTLRLGCPAFSYIS